MLFFEVDGVIKTLNQLGIDKILIMQFLQLGTSDLEKIKDVCTKYNMPIPTEIKMIYNVENGEYEAQYKYEEVCSAATGKNSGEVFLNGFPKLEVDILFIKCRYFCV